MTLILLLSASFLLAGFIDAFVGGGGLIQIRHAHFVAGRTGRIFFLVIVGALIARLAQSIIAP
jgi:hypothetical protein